MTKNLVDDSIADALALPNIVRLTPNLYAAVFSLMKLLPARYMLARARERGQLSPTGTVIETSSGTFALGLAMTCRQMNHRLIIVGDPAIDAQLAQRLSELGAEVECVRQPAAQGGFQRARLDRVAALQARYQDSYCPGQYSNPDNPRAYASLAAQLCEALGEVDVLVGTVGSGGSMCGTARYLRAVNPKLTAVGVDTHGSVIFGQPDLGSGRLLRGLGNSLFPPNVAHGTFDDVHWVGAGPAFAATRALHRAHALFMGPTSGAAYLVARDYAERAPGRKVVFLCADEGYRYQHTVYSDAWLEANGLLGNGWSGAAVEVSHPLQASGPWNRIAWRRRTLQQVLSSDALATAELQ